MVKMFFLERFLWSFQDTKQILSLGLNPLKILWNLDAQYKVQFEFNR